jgi:hypothetical protein
MRATSTIKVDSYSLGCAVGVGVQCKCFICTLHSLYVCTHCIVCMRVNAHLHITYLNSYFPPVLQLVMFDLLFVHECTNFIFSLYSYIQKRIVVLLLIMLRRKCLEPSAQE